MGLDMQQLIGEFSNEANEFLEKAETEIIELEKNPDPEKINAVFRYIHTVKGNSGMFEFQNLSRLSHALESLLGKFREGSLTINKEYIDLMLEAVDRLKLMIRELDKESSFDISSMTEQLKSAAAAEQKKTVTENIAEELTITEEDVVRAFTEDFLKEAAREAEKNHQFASVAVLDLIEQRFQSLGELAEFLSQFGMNIKMRHLLADSIPDLETPSDFLPFAFLILSEQDIKEFLKKYDLRPKFILSLYSPIQLIQSKDTNQKQEKQAAENSDSYLRVRSRLLDDLINLVGETIITRNQLFQRSAFLNDPEGGNILSRMSQLITQLHEKIMHTRLQELNSINQRIQRVVRDTAKNLGKQVEFQFEGGEVELDKTMIDTILDSIIHMVRNSIDHGIETPEERIRKGKNPIGKIRLSASLQIGNIQLVIDDDGQGLNHEMIRKTAEAKGLIPQGTGFTQEEIEELVFLPGFSTAKAVTETSGRGVGMDAVRTSFKKLGGNVHLKTVFGKGTSITAVIPQTVTVISCLLITVDQTRYAIFQKNVSELIQFDPELFTIVNGVRMYRFRESMLPLVHLGKLLYPDREFKDEAEYVVIVKSENYYFGILFDQMIGTEEIVVKPLGEFFSELKLFAGATIMGDGEAVLILDIAGISEFEGIESKNKESESTRAASELKKETGYLLFEIMEHRFATSLEYVTNIEKLSNFQFEDLSGIKVIQYKEDIIPVVSLKDVYSLEGESNQDSSFLIIVSTENKEIAVMINEIVDIVYDIHIVEDNRYHGESVLGHSIINDKSTVIIDIQDLISKISKVQFSWIGKHLNVEPETVHTEHTVQSAG